MRLAIGGATRHGGADAGRQLRIEEVKVETDMQHAISRLHLVNHAADQYSDSELVDPSHIGETDTASAQQILFRLVHRAHAEQFQPIGIDWRARLSAEKALQ